MNSSEPKDPKKGWEELLFGTLEKIVATPGKLKDPQSAIDWFKGLREDLQDRIKEEIAGQVSKIDLPILAKKVSEHLAENYDLKVEAKFSWEKKDKKPTNTESGDSDL